MVAFAICYLLFSNILLLAVVSHGKKFGGPTNEGRFLAFIWFWVILGIPLVTLATQSIDREVIMARLEREAKVRPPTR